MVGKHSPNWLNSKSPVINGTVDSTCYKMLIVSRLILNLFNMSLLVVNKRFLMDCRYSCGVSMVDPGVIQTFLPQLNKVLSGVKVCKSMKD